MGFPRSTRRLLAALCTLVISFTILAGGASAAPSVTNTEPSVTSNYRGNCTGPTTTDHAGQRNTTSSPTYSRSGVKATINLSEQDFDICLGGDSNHEGPSIWVSIEPKLLGDPTKIIQVGIQECRHPFEDSCQGENNPYFFWAFGGCFPWTPVPSSLGPADLGVHNLAIYLNTDDFWYINIDGGDWEARVPDSYVDCWTNGLRSANYFAERWDRGDSTGTSPAPLSFLTDAYYGAYNLGWFKDYWAPGSWCHYGTSTSHCRVQSPGDGFYFYSTPA